MYRWRKILCKHFRKRAESKVDLCSVAARGFRRVLGLFTSRWLHDRMDQWKMVSSVLGRMNPKNAECLLGREIHRFETVRLICEHQINRIVGYMAFRNKRAYAVLEYSDTSRQHAHLDALLALMQLSVPHMLNWTEMKITSSDQGGTNLIPHLGNALVLTDRNRIETFSTFFRNAHFRAQHAVSGVLPVDQVEFKQRLSALAF